MVRAAECRRAELRACPRGMLDPERTATALPPSRLPYYPGFATAKRLRANQETKGPLQGDRRPLKEVRPHNDNPHRLGSLCF
jgi:hypothetical protein